MEVQARPQGCEIEGAPRRHSVLQGGGTQEGYNPCRHLLGQGEPGARLRLLRQGGREQDEVHQGLLRREEVEAEVRPTTGAKVGAGGGEDQGKSPAGSLGGGPVPGYQGPYLTNGVPAQPGELRRTPLLGTSVNKPHSRVS